MYFTILNYFPKLKILQRLASAYSYHLPSSSPSIPSKLYNSVVKIWELSSWFAPVLYFYAIPKLNISPLRTETHHFFPVIGFTHQDRFPFHWWRLHSSLYPWSLQFYQQEGRKTNREICYETHFQHYLWDDGSWRKSFQGKIHGRKWVSAF